MHACMSASSVIGLRPTNFRSEPGSDLPAAGIHLSIPICTTSLLQLRIHFGALHRPRPVQITRPHPSNLLFANRKVAWKVGWLSRVGAESLIALFFRYVTYSSPRYKERHSQSRPRILRVHPRHFDPVRRVHVTAKDVNTA